MKIKIISSMFILLYLLILRAEQPIAILNSGSRKYLVQDYVDTPYYLQYGSSYKDGIFAYNFRNNPKEARAPYGPLLIFEEDGKALQITNNLSTLDYALRKIIAAHEKENGKTDYKWKVRGQCLTKYLETPGELLIYGNMLEQFKNKLKAAVGEAKCDELSPLLEVGKFEKNEHVWCVEITVITADGGIERRGFSGISDPLSIKKMQVEVKAPPGTIPNFPIDQLIQH